MRRSGWSSPADTSQWVKHRRAEELLHVVSNRNKMCSSVLQKREVNTVLADIIKHMTPDRGFEDAYPQVSGSLFSSHLAASSHTPAPRWRRLCFSFLSCSRWSGRSSPTSTTSPSSSQWWASTRSQWNVWPLQGWNNQWLPTCVIPRSVSCRSSTCSRRTAWGWRSADP